MFKFSYYFPFSSEDFTFRCLSIRRVLLVSLYMRHTLTVKRILLVFTCICADQRHPTDNCCLNNIKIDNTHMQKIINGWLAHENKAVALVRSQCSQGTWQVLCGSWLHWCMQINATLDCNVLHFLCLSSAGVNRYAQLLSIKRRRLSRSVLTTLQPGLSLNHYKCTQFMVYFSTNESTSNIFTKIHKSRRFSLTLRQVVK